MGMKVSCMQDNLAHGLNIVSRAVNPRSTLPVLANVLLATDNGRLRLAATNLEMGITAWIGASVEEDGEITVPARTLIDLVNTLSPERVDMEVSVRTQSLHLACGATTANIKGIDAREFPVMPEPGEDDEVLPVPADVMRDTINMVAFASARDDSRPILTGVSIIYQDGLLTMAAADGFRLSVREIPLEAEYYGSFSLVVPARTLSELARIISDEDEVVYLILPDEHSQVLFHMSNVDVVTQVIDGTFPDYHRIIPQDLTTRTIVDTADFLRACKRADIFAREANHTVRLKIEPQEGMAGVMRVYAQSAETGENEGVLTASIEGEGMEIAFNVRYLIEVLSVIRQDRVVIGTSSPDKPGVLRPVGDDTFTHVIMPMHIGR
ncbi:MAG TPA: DNA polymerase III subunit beta [Chloroflexi bacterium]|nr:DNA polymerase III subunit beta [Chloroflexota bacterium]